MIVGGRRIVSGGWHGTGRGAFEGTAVSKDIAKVRCRCPSCGCDTMFLTLCEEEPSAGDPGFYCRGCGSEWTVEEIREIADGYAKALALADAVFGEGTRP